MDQLALVQRRDGLGGVPHRLDQPPRLAPRADRKGDARELLDGDIRVAGGRSDFHAGEAGMVDVRAFPQPRRLLLGNPGQLRPAAARRVPGLPGVAAQVSHEDMAAHPVVRVLRRAGDDGARELGGGEHALVDEQAGQPGEGLAGRGGFGQAAVDLFAGGEAEVHQQGPVGLVLPSQLLGGRGGIQFAEQGQPGPRGRHCYWRYRRRLEISSSISSEPQ